MFEHYMIAGFILMALGWSGANTKPGLRLFSSHAAAVIPVSALILGTALFTRGLWLFVKN